MPRRLINLVRIQNPIEFFVKYGNTPKHLLHIGAHLLEESEIYNDLGVTKISWVEANVKLESSNRERFPDANILYRAVTDVDDSKVTLNLTTNSVSSSIYHIDSTSSFSKVSESESFEVLTKTLDSVCKWANQSAGDKVDSLVIDVQGAEGVILNGLCDSLHEIHALAIEVSHRSFYLGAEEYLNIHQNLRTFGLRRATKFINPLTGHGDELWISKNLSWVYYQKLRMVGAIRDLLIVILRYYGTLILSNKNK
jgi:FkbM family methyltransferase